MPRSQNLQAFLDTIAASEGTLGKGDDGYNVLVGGSLFEGYDDHPRQHVRLSDRLFSTAAGRYQVLARYFDTYKTELALADFSPASQDAIAIRMISERGALADVEAGQFAVAIGKCRKGWASLPGAGYGQHENSLGKLEQIYRQRGGALAP